MMEKELIQKILKGFARSPNQLNQAFESDAEILLFGDELWAVTTDDFSPEEDLFPSDDLHLLGWNLTVATLSDLLAVGADPRFFIHALCQPKSAEQILEGLAVGVSEALKQAECFLIGGDLGVAPTWRFCGTALGKIKSGRPLPRVLSANPQTLWVTGAFGDASIAALTGSAMPRFELRIDEMRRIRELATACTDTSGGLFRSFWDLLAVSPGCAIELNKDALPLATGVREILTSMKIAPEAALLSGAGEYELLFALPEGETADDVATCIGCVVPSKCNEVRIGRATMSAPPPDPRSVPDVETHIKEVIAVSEKLFHG